MDRLIDDALSKLAAMEAFETISKEYMIPDSVMDYLKISSSAIKDSVTISVAAILEEHKTCGKTNCSLGEVKNLLANDTGFRLSDESRKNLTDSIEDLTNTYRESGIKNLRNKTKAHFDLDEFFVREQGEASVKELRDLLFGARKIMNYFFNKWLGITVDWEDYDNRVSRYKQSLLAFIA